MGPACPAICAESSSTPLLASASLGSFHLPQSAMAVYTDLQLAHVDADGKIYGLLMTVAARSGDLALAKQLQAEMGREGLPPCQVRGRGGGPTRCFG